MRDLRALPYGECAVLLEADGPAAVAQLARLLSDAPPAGLEEFVPAARTVLIRFDPARTSANRIVGDARALAASQPSGNPPSEAAPLQSATGLSPVVIPVVYDGADLTAVAAMAGMSAQEVVARHTAASYHCGFCGFAPGFSYLVGGDPALRPPRLDEPRSAVPAGSVAIAGEFSAVYPTASPGGWRLLGRTDVAMWDLARQPPALVPPGISVRFQALRASARGRGAA